MKYATTFNRCECCGKELSDNPMGQFSHKSKHVREGKMRRVQAKLTPGVVVWKFEVVNAD